MQTSNGPSNCLGLGVFLHVHCGRGGDHSLPYGAAAMKKHSILKCIVNYANCANVYIIRKQESTSLLPSENISRVKTQLL